MKLYNYISYKNSKIEVNKELYQYNQLRSEQIIIIRSEYITRNIYIKEGSTRLYNIYIRVLTNYILPYNNIQSEVVILRLKYKTYYTYLKRLYLDIINSY